MRVRLELLVAVVVCFAVVPAAVAAVPCASWKTAEKDLRAAWAKGYPNEKLVSVTANGEASAYDKLKSTGQEKIDEYGDKWEAYSKQKFCRVPATAVAQQGAGQRKFSVSAIYVVKGGKFSFDDIGVGESQAIAAAGQEAPSKDDMKKMIAAYYVEKNPNVKVEKVALSAAELKADSSKGRWWYSVGADIFIVAEDGTKQKCSNDYTTFYKGEKGLEGVDATGPYKVYFLDDPSCN
jgi:hypothetical protein